MLQSSGQISFSDVILEHRPNNTTVGSGLKPFLLNDYSSYSTSVGAPLQFSDFYETQSTYNTTRFDQHFSGPDTQINLTWSNNIFDVLEVVLSSDQITVEDPDTECVISIPIPSGGSYKCRYHVISTSNLTHASLHGTGASTIVINGAGQGFFGPVTSTLHLQTHASNDGYVVLYTRIIRIS